MRGGATYEDVPEDVTILKERSENVYTHNGEGVVGFVWGGLYDISMWKDVRFPEGKKWEDFAVSYKIKLADPYIAVVDAKLYYYFINPDGIMKSSSIEDRLFELECYKQQIKYFKKHDIPPVYKTLVSSYLQSLCAKVSKIRKERLRNKVCDSMLLKTKFEMIRYGKTSGFDFSGEHRWMLYLTYPTMMTAIDKIESIIKGKG